MPDGINQYWRDGRFDLYICPRNSRPSSKGAPEHHNLRLVVTTNIQQALPRRSAGTRASYASGGGGASRVPRIAGDVTAGSARVSCVLVGYAPCTERRRL